MPFLQYKCTKCGKRFEELVKVYTDKVVCPDCGGETERDYAGTMYSSTGKTTKKYSLFFCGFFWIILTIQ